MYLFARLVRSLWVFWLIFASYLVQIGLARVLRRWERDPETGREEPVLPGWLERRRKRVDKTNAKRLLRGMLRLRGVYIKLGQVLSIMGGFLPRVYGRELEALQDHVPPQPFKAMRAAFVESMGRRPQECFERIEEEPIAAASLGQVHVAWRHDGRKMAVKILYPGIRDIVAVDMKVVRLGIRAYKMFVPVRNIERVHEALVDLLERETDYVHEASCLEQMAANFEDEDDIVFPEVDHELSSKDVLTMTFVEGIKITKVDELEEAGVDRTAVAERLVQCFYRQLFVHRVFHADPHPGNFFVQPGDPPGLVILDFGAVSEVDRKTVDGMVDVLQGFFEQNDALVLQGVERIGFVAPNGNRELLESTVKTYFGKLLKVKDRTAGALMRAGRDELEQLADPEVERRQLRDLMRSVQYPEGWFFVERAAVLMFWLVGQIDPELDTLQVGFPYVLPLLAERTSQAVG